MSDMIKHKTNELTNSKTVDASSLNSRKLDPTTLPRDATKKTLPKDRKEEELKNADFPPKSTHEDAESTVPSEPQAEFKKPAAIKALPLQ
jgi:hypothetical protein